MAIQHGRPGFDRDHRRENLLYSLLPTIQSGFDDIEVVGVRGVVLPSSKVSEHTTSPFSKAIKMDSLVSSGHSLV